VGGPPISRAPTPVDESLGQRVREYQAEMDVIASMANVPDAVVAETLRQAGRDAAGAAYQAQLDEVLTRLERGGMPSRLYQRDEL